MDAVRSWALGVACAAVAAAMAESLCPKGTVKRIAALAGSLLLAIALLRPLAQWKDFDLASNLERYRAELEPYSGRLAAENENLMRELIVEKVAAYIVDKAAELGFSCTALVEVQPGEDGTPLPWSVEIVGGYTSGQQKALTQLIEETLGISAERQTYRRGEVK